MMNSRRQIGFLVAFLCLMTVTSGSVNAGLLSVAIVESDDLDSAQAAQTSLLATGLFSNVSIIDVNSSTPTLAQLQQYSSVLAYTNYTPSDPTALGNVLGQYVNGGGGVVLSTYALSNPWAIGGLITTTGYSPLVNLGVNGNVSGNLVAAAGQGSNPIFNGVNLASLVYFNNYNFAQPGLDTGATLLATDGNGVNMIAVNATGNVIADNLFPGGIYGSSQSLYQLIGNELVSVATTSVVPEPSSIVMATVGVLGVLGFRQIKRKKA